MVKESNVLVFDDFGIPSIMVKFEKCGIRESIKDASADGVDPVFIIRGEEYDEIYVSKYPNTLINGRAYSLPNSIPAANLTLDEAIAACRGKGPGWHLMTAIEYEFIVRDGFNKGFEAHGNTDGGCYHLDKDEAGTRCYNAYGKTLTGSGPVTWFHDNTSFGVSDVVGNVWKMVSGFRLNHGVIQVIKDNDAAADDADLSKDSKEWTDVLADGKPVRLAIDDNSKIRITTDEYEGDYGCDIFRSIEIDLDVCPDVLKLLGIIPAKDDSENVIFVDTEEDEVIPLRGGGYVSTSNAGPCALNLFDARSGADGDVGFFSAYYKKKPVC